MERDVPETEEPDKTIYGQSEKEKAAEQQQKDEEIAEKQRIQRIKDSLPIFEQDLSSAAGSKWTLNCASTPTDY